MGPILCENSGRGPVASALVEGQFVTLGNAGARFRNDIVEGPGGKQILLQDASGNVVELFQPAAVR